MHAQENVRCCQVSIAVSQLTLPLTALLIVVMVILVVASYVTTEIMEEYRTTVKGVLLIVHLRKDTIALYKIIVQFVKQNVEMAL